KKSKLHSGHSAGHCRHQHSTRRTTSCEGCLQTVRCHGGKFSATRWRPVYRHERSGEQPKRWASCSRRPKLSGHPSHAECRGVVKKRHRAYKTERLERLG